MVRPTGPGGFFSMVCPTGPGGIRIFFFNGLPNGPGGIRFSMVRPTRLEGFRFSMVCPTVGGIRFSMVRPTGLRGRVFFSMVRPTGPGGVSDFFFNGPPNGPGRGWADQCQTPTGWANHSNAVRSKLGLTGFRQPLNVSGVSQVSHPLSQEGLSQV